MKDKDNLYSFNQWSATEYYDKTKEFIVFNANNTLIESNNNWSNIGEKCLKITKLSNNANWVRIYYNESKKSKNINGKLTIKTLNSDVNVYLIELNPDGDNTKVVGVNIPDNSIFNVNISFISNNISNRFVLQIIIDDIQESCYIDNIQLYSS